MLQGNDIILQTNGNYSPKEIVFSYAEMMQCCFVQRSCYFIDKTFAVGKNQIMFMYCIVRSSHCNAPTNRLVNIDPVDQLTPPSPPRPP